MPGRAAVSLIFFANGALIANWFARIPDIKQQLGLSEGAFSLALLSMAVGALVAQPITGWGISRVGSRKITMAMALTFCALIILPGFADSLFGLGLVLLLVGASNGALDVAMNAQAALVEHRYHRPIMSSFHGLWSVGGLLGAALAVAGGLPVAAHFSIAAVVGALMMLIALRGLIPDGPAPASHEPTFALPTRALLPMGIIVDPGIWTLKVAEIKS